MLYYYISIVILTLGEFIMRLMNVLSLFLIFIILIVTINGIAASDVSDLSEIDDNILSSNSIDNELTIDENQNNNLQETENVTAPKTVVVRPDSDIPNQVLRPTVQPAIDEANPGDTIILRGNFVHCHFVVTKPLIIKSYSSTTTISPCPHHNNPLGSNMFGIFYITPEASGTTIEGFNFVNTDYTIANGPQNPFAIFADGADNITIKDCIVNWNLNESFLYDGIIIKDADNVNIDNIYFNNTKRSFVIENSSNVSITNSKIENGRVSAVEINDNSKNILIKNNEILNCTSSGINVSSAEGIHIINNVIMNNGKFNEETGSGVYINCNISDSEVKGNLMMNNGLHAVLIDYRVRNMGTAAGDDYLLLIENNYFDGHKDMVVHRRIFEKDEYGTYNYDEENDIYYKADNGQYLPAKAIFYMKSAYVAHDIVCGFTYYSPAIHWSDENYIKASISQVKKGVYKLTLADGKGNLAADLSSVDAEFYLNLLSGVSKTVTLENGSATVDFTDNTDSYLKTGNTILAVLPTEDSIQFNVSDSDIPVKALATKITASKLTTYPLSDSYFKVKLTDESNKAVSSKIVKIKINGKTYSAKTDKNGIAKVKVSLTSKKTYTASISFAGDENYKSSKSSAKIVVKTGSKKSKISLSAMKVKKNTKKTLSLKLTTSAGKALASQKVIIKLNGKSYTLKTSKKGIAKLSFKLPKAKKYTVSAKFLGNANYKAISKTIVITVV